MCDIGGQKYYLNSNSRQQTFDESLTCVFSKVDFRANGVNFK